MRITRLVLFLLCVTSVFAATKPYRVRSIRDSESPRVHAITALPDTMRILVIRVDFPRDTLSTTTGDGGFDFGAREGRKIDPPPHDSMYFQQQFQFVNNYFHQVSKGKVTLQTDVYPSGNRNAYRMPEPLWHYHPDPTNNDLTNRLITQLWKTAWDSAAKDTSILFNIGSHNNPIWKYDIFVVVHAGGGNEYDLGFNDTPFNIPSGFITRTDYKNYLNITDPRGLPIRNDIDTVFIPEGSLLPELSSQKVGNEWVDIGNGGLYCLLIGRALGLPFLYDVDNGTSRVGRWSLMDRGFGTFFGILPGYPDAYSRVRMGWATPVPAPLSGTVRLQTPQSDSAGVPEVMRFEGAASEYFLMENRNRDPDSLDYTYVYDAANRRAKLTNQYEIVLDPSITDSFGVVVRADNYEFDTPGSGVLIWRVNSSEEQRREALGLSPNTGDAPYVLKLIEGDGAEDIGQNYGFFSPGSGTETGSPYDAYFRNNTEWSLANNGDAVVRFFPDVNPPSKLSNGAPTSFNLTQFSQPGRVMSFNVFHAVQLPGEIHFRIPSYGSPMAAIPFDANGDEKEEFWIADSNRIYAFSQSGSSLGTIPTPFVRHDSITGSTTDSIMTYAVGQLTGPPIVKMVAGRRADTSWMLLHRHYSNNTDNRFDAIKIIENDTVYSMIQIGNYVTGEFGMAFDSANGKWLIDGDFDTTIVFANLDLSNLPITRIPTHLHITIWDPNAHPYQVPGVYRPNFTLPRIGIGVVTPYVAYDDRLSILKNNNWIDVGLDTHPDMINSLSWTTENLFILTKSQWWLWGGTTVRTDFPRRVPSVNTPTVSVAGYNGNNEPIIWYGTESGELWNLMRTGNDNRYPIAVGIQSIDGIALLSSHTNGATDSIRLAAVSRDGGVYLTTQPLAGITGATWACPTGTASGIPKFTPEKEWSNTFDQGLTYAFIWPNPVRNGQAYIRVGSNISGMLRASAEVYDMRGDRVATLQNPYPVEGGGYEWKWDTGNCSRGLYVVRVKAPGAAVKLIKAAVIR